MAEKFKINENSRISILRADEEMVNTQDGRKMFRAHWEVLKKPLSLGSLVEPKNKDVKRIKIEVASEEDENNPFSKFFKGFT